MNSDEDKFLATSHKPFIGMIEAAGIAVAAAVASIQARFAIGRRMGSNFDEMAQKEGSLAHVIQKELIEKISEVNSNPDLHGKKLAAKMGAIYKQNEEKVGKYWADRHVTGMLSKLESLKPHQRLEVLFGTVAVFTVALGVTLGFAKSEEVTNFFRRHGHSESDERKQAQR